MSLLVLVLSVCQSLLMLPWLGSIVPLALLKFSHPGHFLSVLTASSFFSFLSPLTSFCHRPSSSCPCSLVSFIFLLFPTSASCFSFPVLLQFSCPPSSFLLCDFPVRLSSSAWSCFGRFPDSCFIFYHAHAHAIKKCCLLRVSVLVLVHYQSIKQIKVCIAYSL